MPVIFTEFISDPTVPTLRKDPFRPEHLTPSDSRGRGWGKPSGSCIPGSDGPESPEIIDALKPREDETIVYAYGLDKFYGTPLGMVLRARDVRYLIMTGILADLCVLSTTFSAMAREYRVTTVSDGIATLWPDILKSVLDIVDRKLARLKTSSEVMTEISQPG